MSVNSSSSVSAVAHCMDSESANLMSIAFTITRIFLLLPLSALVLYLGHRRWRQQRSFATLSHSDIFTYHMVVVELVVMLAAIFYFCGLAVGLSELIMVGIYATGFVYPGQMCFQILTCVERYLAVVHPITYLELRQSGGVRLRNISIGCVWLLGFGWIGLTALYLPEIPYIPFFCMLGFSLVVVCFCSLCVIRVLIRPGPGDVGGDRVRVDQSKQRAFYTITAIMGVLGLWLAGSILGLALDRSELLSYSDGCLLLVAANWFSLPSSLLLPLLFLHRAGKLLCTCL
ncbi:uncharacterized protein LOC111236664 [Seriola dumerili]|uniref:uncharacterized protein LOC111236664 n=1 Tax=Seriola dumerili TaxID=41447 RepID=UPI000BBE4B74|nr:uncharacterized protein LOC111236664 [Seriola dumerili]